MKSILPLIFALGAAPAIAQDTRELDAHEHGVGELNIAVQGGTVAMELHAPGADIVGFEYEATSDDDIAAIEAAKTVLSRPTDLFVLPASAGCTVVNAAAELEGEDDHGDHAEGHDHDDHADHGDHDDHADHDDHDAAEGASHTEFHATYELTCADPSALSEISFAYFDTFPNARELEVQIVSGSGAQAFEVTRDDPNLALTGLF